MKLSCSAYQAGSHYAQKILTGHMQNYGATSSTTNTSGESTHGLKMPTWQVEEIEGKGSPNDNSDSPVEGSSSQGAGKDKKSDGGGGGGAEHGASSRHTSLSSDGHQERHSDSTSKTHDSSRSPSESPAHRLESRSRSKSVGEQQWTNLRAVMAWYARLRRIKRTKSNQRWMKLRTTVQLSGAVSSAIQKKAPLKREDSFLKRFSTRQVPIEQFNGSQTEDLHGTRFCLETFEIGEDDGVGGLSGGQKVRRKKKPSLPRSVVNPDGNFYFYWLMILTFCVLYNLWTLIVRESFPELQADGQLYWILTDAFSDLIFLLDIAVQFRTGYLEQGLMVYKTKKLAKHYIGSRPFYLDLVSLTPTDLAQFYFGTHPLFRVPRFLKIYRIYKYYYMVESRTVYPNIWRVVNLIHILLLLAHWFACFYYLLSEAENFEGHWVYPNPIIHPGFETVTRKYLASLYWSTLTLTTIGDLPTPYSNWQYLFTIVSYLIGVFTFATIVGQVGNVITNRNANRLEFERLLDGAKMYMRHHKVPRDMQRRVLRWYDYSWSRGRIQGGGDINTALGLLPDKLKTELALHVNLSVLKKVTIFQECQPEFLHDLVLKMKAYIFTPGDLICRKGEVAREMFIIADGILEVISEAGRVLTTMQAGDFFGEIGILNLDGLNKRTADVRSVGYSELFSLSREDVLAAMKDYPEAQEILQTLGRKRLMEARKAAGPPALKKHTEKKSSPLHLLGHSIRKGSDDSPGEKTGKRIVEKLRSDVKGLRNAIRRSRKSNSSKEDSSEQESSTKEGRHDGSSSSASLRKQSSVSVSTHPYYSSVGLEGRAASIAGGVLPMRSVSGVSRGVLKRMHHVVLSDEREKAIASGGISPPPSGAIALSPIKKRVQVQTAPPEIIYQSSTIAQKRGRGSISSPPPPPTSLRILEDREVIGAGLPLIQRLRLLRQKEEREAKAKTKEEEGKQQLFTKATMGALQHRDSVSSATTSTFSEPLFPGSSRIATYTSPVPITPPSPALLLGSSSNKRSLSFASEHSSESAPSTSTATESDKQPESGTIVKPRPLALGLQKNTKTYGSIDDLSPEFSRLPFIKKLKILNERQKIAELLTTQSSTAVLTRSTSEGSSALSPSSQGSEMMHSILQGRRTRSTSDGRQSLQTQVKSEITQFLPLLSSSSSSSPSSESESAKKTLMGSRILSEPSTSQPLSLSSGDSTATVIEVPKDDESPPYSPESNETPERRRLKSILKRLQSEAESATSSVEIEKLKREIKKSGLSEEQQQQLLASEQDEIELMKAPTLEGFAARHRKLTKNVTFQRQAVSSPDEGPLTPSESLKTPETISTKDEQRRTDISGQHLSTNLNQDQQLLPAEGVIKLSSEEQQMVTPFNSEALKSKLASLIFMTPDNSGGESHSKTSHTLESLGLNLGLGVAQEECISGIFFGIKSLIHGKMEEMQSKFQDRFMTLETEVRRRDEIITILQQRIQELEEKSLLGYYKGEKYFRYSNGRAGSAAATIKNLSEHRALYGNEELDDDDDEEIIHLSREQSSAQPSSNYQFHHQSSYLFSRGDSIDTVISNQDFDDDVFLMVDENQGDRTTLQQQGFNSSLYPLNQDEPGESIEMTEFPHYSSSSDTIPMWQLEFHRDSLSVTTTTSTTTATTTVPPPSPADIRPSEAVTVDIGNTSTEFEDSSSESESEGEDGRKLSRVLKEQKISLDDDEEQQESSSDEDHKKGGDRDEEEEDDDDDDDEDEDLDGLTNKNWEVQLLIKEMEKQESQKKQQSVIMEEEEEPLNIGEIRMIEDEMREMRDAVSSGALSPTDLDMLESVIEIRSQRVKEIWKAYSTESEGGAHGPSFAPKSRHVGRSVEDFRTSSGDPSSSIVRRGSRHSEAPATSYNSYRRASKRTSDQEQEKPSSGARSRRGSKSVKRQASLCETGGKKYDVPTSFTGVSSKRRESADSLAKFPPDSAKSIFSKFRLMRTLSKMFHLSSSPESFETRSKTPPPSSTSEGIIPITTSSSADFPKSSSAASSSGGHGILPLVSSVISSALHRPRTSSASGSTPEGSADIFTIPSTSSAVGGTEEVATCSSSSSRPKLSGENQPLLKK